MSKLIFITTIIALVLFGGALFFLYLGFLQLSFFKLPEFALAPFVEKIPEPCTIFLGSGLLMSCAAAVGYFPKKVFI